MLLLDLVDRRTMWRDYWIEWALAALLLLLNEIAEWCVAGLMGAPLPFRRIVPPLLISHLRLPDRRLGRRRGIDRWRLGR